LGETIATPEDEPHERHTELETRVFALLGAERPDEAHRLLSTELAFAERWLLGRGDEDLGPEGAAELVDLAVAGALRRIADYRPGRGGLLYWAWHELVRCLDASAGQPFDEAECWAEFERALATHSRERPGSAPGAPVQSVNGIEHELSELYGELRRRAEQLMRHQPRDHTLQPTALANEACLKLIGRADLAGIGRDELFALACHAMRNVLIDHARKRGRLKRSATREHLPIDDLRLSYEERSIDLVGLGDALIELQALDPRMVKVVDLHFFGGLDLKDTARLLAMPQRTLERHWAMTKAWLRKRIE
jgi:RNA polymerase sigma-70 factor (ECF subfamily)